MRQAEEEFAKTRQYLASRGHNTDAKPRTDLEVFAVQRSADSIAGLQRREADNEVRHRRWIPQAQRQRFALAAFALSGTVIILALSLVAPWGTPSASATTPTPLAFSRLSAGSDVGEAPVASGLLQLLAQRASEQPAATDAGAGYAITTSSWSLTSSLDTTSTQAAVVPFQSVTTVDPDGSMVRVEQRGEPLTPDGRGAANGVERLLGPRVQTDRFPPGYIDLQLTSVLPRDPVELREALLVRTGCPREISSEVTVCLLKEVDRLYSDQPVPGDLAAALWRVLAGEPALRQAGDGTDRTGRNCVAVVVESAGDQRREVWFLLADPQTGSFLGIEHVLVEGSLDGVSAPAVLDFNTLISTRPSY